jgi:hypothetical protein
MPDISMCSSKECPMFKQCYRAQATPGPYRQAYSYFYKEGKKCDYFIPMRKEDYEQENT